ncbi:MAG: Gfo/Idh/MocA family oxidoreductase [Phycisphaerae bacterium]|nr:Gfo/Idh/MocA family oxidoreductase [Phycisphaerae bacterium]
MITINCIGAGRWGPNLARSFSNLPDARVHIICDLREQRLEVIRKRIPGIETTTDANRAIDDPQADAVVVATPVQSHYALTKRALQAGKHVLVEKPLCSSVEQCEELSALADDRGLILAVGHVFLFNNGIRKVYELIQSGTIGCINYIHATRTNLGPIRDDVNAVWDLGAHDLSIFDYWLGCPPVAVTARGECYLNQPIDDVVVASYTYPGKVLGCVHTSWLNPRKVREITVVGERKMVVWNDMDLIEPVRVYDKSVDFAREQDYTDSFGATRMSIRDGDVLIPKVPGGEPLQLECQHFIECILHGTKPINNTAAATQVVRSLLATDESMRRCGVEVPIENPVRAPEPELVATA